MRAAPIRFAVAERKDDAAIRRLLRENPMGGRVRLTFEREPDYFNGSERGFVRDKTIVAFADDRLVCMGRSSQWQCWVDGQPRHVGYLAELRLDASAEGRVRILRDGYRFFHNQENGASPDLYFTSVGAENTRARRLLESNRSGLPSYSLIGELSTLLISVPQRAKPGKLKLVSATSEDVSEIVAFLNEHGDERQFATFWTVGGITDLRPHGLPSDSFLLAREEDQLIAVAALWDQRKFRQTVVRGYPPFVSVTRPLFNAGRALLGQPGLPSAGSILPYALLSPLVCSKDKDALLADVIEGSFMYAANRGLKFLALSLPADSDQISSLTSRFSTRTWGSCIYLVTWPDREPVTLKRSNYPVLPDLGFL